MGLRGLRAQPARADRAGRSSPRRAARSRAAAGTTWSTARGSSRARWWRAPPRGVALRHGSRRARASASAARFYDVRLAVPRERCTRSSATASWWRRCSATARARRPTTASRPPEAPPAWAPAQAPTPCCCTRRAARDKRWPEERWIALGALLARARATRACCPAARDAERATAARLAAALPGAIAAPAMDLAERRRSSRTRAVVAGVDTGLTHLAVALGAPDGRHLLRDAPRAHRPARRAA